MHMKLKPDTSGFNLQHHYKGCLCTRRDRVVQLWGVDGRKMGVVGIVEKGKFRES